MIIGENHASTGEHGLLLVVGGHLPASDAEVFLNTSPAVFMQLQRQAQRIGHRFPGDVVRGWSQAAGEDNQIAAAHG